MRVAGKIIGMTAGYLLGSGKWWVVLLGLLAGHWLDKLRTQDRTLKKRVGTRSDWKRVTLLPSSASDQADAEIAISYCQALFVLLGRITKLDGHVSERDIQWVESLMAKMSIRGRVRDYCIDLFREGKSLKQDVTSVMSALHWQLYSHTALKHQFVETLVASIYIDGQFNRSGWILVLEVAAKLGYPETKLWQLRHHYEDQLSKDGTSSRPSSSRRSSARASGRHADNGERHRERYKKSEEYSKAYQEYDQQSVGGTVSRVSKEEALHELGISTHEWSDFDLKKLKRVYRKLMSQHHPDKLIASGASERQVQRAKSKTQKVRAAYDKLATFL